MSVVVNVVELNRTRLVALEGITLALAEAIAAGETDDQVDDGTSLNPVRELVRALRGLLVQPLPEGMIAGTSELAVELEAPAAELEQLADELEALAVAGAESAEGSDGPGRVLDGLYELVGRLRQRAAARV